MFLKILPEFQHIYMHYVLALIIVLKILDLIRLN